MKRSRMIEESTEGRCAATNLSILASYRSLLDEDRNASETDQRKLKKSKVEITDRQEAIKNSTEDGKGNESGDDQKVNEEKTKLHYLDLVSSAASLIFEERQNKKKQADTFIPQQQPQEQACISHISTNTPSRTSRSSSVSSEHSVYRSYEMELPVQPLQYNAIKARLPRPPRFPTASDIPLVEKSANNNICKLNTRRYGEQQQHLGLEQRASNYGENQLGTNNVNSSLPKSVLIETVIYQWCHKMQYKDYPLSVTCS